MRARAEGPDSASVEAFEAVRVLADEVLSRSGAKGVIPTPLDVVARWVGIHDVQDIGEFNSHQRKAHRPRRSLSVLKRFLGAVLYEQKIVLLDTTKPDTMRRWTEAHELAHKLVPWHAASTYLDDDSTLTPMAVLQQEREANVGGAHLLFQGPCFWNESRDYRSSLAVPVKMAPTYAASLTATIRYYVESHVDPMGLLCLSRYVQNRSRRVTYSLESGSFRDRFGPIGDLFPTRVRARHGTPFPERLRCNQVCLFRTGARQGTYLLSRSQRGQCGSRC